MARWLKQEASISFFKLSAELLRRPVSLIETQSSQESQLLTSTPEFLLPWVLFLPTFIDLRQAKGSMSAPPYCKQPCNKPTGLPLIIFQVEKKLNDLELPIL
ncbi:hypothetical protein P245_25450 [Comamonas thiooxydans]|uniref:Uncharacterized protein n=1 Tax=Comamonas thiooxydans TaxID=363952 RepID=A0A0E3B8B7_9BURK|nr:hypothetical protein P245_25450 [Comamonas thiooxydans]